MTTNTIQVLSADKKQVTFAVNVDLIGKLIDEAAKNIYDLLDTPKATELSVRHPLPDELEGSAIMLRQSGDSPLYSVRSVEETAELLDEAAKDLRALLPTPEAVALGVRPQLPNELDAVASMLRYTVTKPLPAPDSAPAADVAKRPKP